MIAKKQSRRHGVDRRNLYTLNKQQVQQSFMNVDNANNAQQQQYDESSMSRQLSQLQMDVEQNMQQSVNSSQQQQQSTILNNSSSQSQPGHDSHQRRAVSSSKLLSNRHRHQGNKISGHNNTSSYQHQIVALEMRIKQLEQQNSLLKNSICTHEQRQQQMITKYSKLQANNKRVAYQLSKVTKTNYQHQLQQQNLLLIKTTITNQTKLNQQILAQIDKQNLRIVTYLKSLLTKIIHHNNTNNSTQTESITVYLQKCIQTLKENRKNIHKKYSLQQQTQYEHKQNISQNITISNNKQQQSPLALPIYETQRIPQLLKQNSTLKQQLLKVRQNFEKLSQAYKKTSTQRQSQFKNQQKLLCEKYNSAINQIKHKYKTLEIKIHQQQTTYRLKLSQLQKMLAQKQKVIKKLKDQLREANVRLDQIEEERFSLLRSSVQQKDRDSNVRRESINNYGKKSMKKYVDGCCLNQSLLVENKDHRVQSNSGYYERYDHLHEESLCEYRPQRKRKNAKSKQQKLQTPFEQPIMRKSHKNKNINDSANQPDVQKQQQDIQQLNKQIELLEKQILEQFEYST